PKKWTPDPAFRGAVQFGAGLCVLWEPRPRGEGVVWDDGISHKSQPELSPAANPWERRPRRDGRATRAWWSAVPAPFAPRAGLPQFELLPQAGFPRVGVPQVCGAPLVSDSSAVSYPPAAV